MPAAERVVDLAAEAVRTGSRATLVAAFALAARRCAEAEPVDIRDGLIAMPLPFRAAEKLGLDVDEVVAEARGQLRDRAEELLAMYASRPDRSNIGVMGWYETHGPDVFASGGR